MLTQEIWYLNKPVNMCATYKPPGIHAKISRQIDWLYNIIHCTRLPYKIRIFACWFHASGASWCWGEWKFYCFNVALSHWWLRCRKRNFFFQYTLCLRLHLILEIGSHLCHSHLNDRNIKALFYLLQLVLRFHGTQHFHIACSFDFIFIIVFVLFSFFYCFKLTIQESQSTLHFHFKIPTNLLKHQTCCNIVLLRNIFTIWLISY